MNPGGAAISLTYVAADRVIPGEWPRWLQGRRRQRGNSVAALNLAAALLARHGCKAAPARVKH